MIYRYICDLGHSAVNLGNFLLVIKSREIIITVCRRVSWGIIIIV